MASHRKIGVLTFHRCINYGSYWQARCLVEGLRALGHDAELLDHHCDEVMSAELRCALQPKLPERSPRQEIRAYTAKVRRFCEAFRRLPLSNPFSLNRPADAGHYDAILVGSDEVWNFRHPWFGGRPIFFGEGLRADRLASYAASFGNHSASDGIHEHWAAKLGEFAALSVRDGNSRQLLQGRVGIDPAIVLDPCLQFPAPAMASASGQYALLYGHGFPAWLQRSIRRWSSANDIPLLSVGYSNDWADEQYVAAGPAEFAALFAGAQAVVTNFFHGCIFALLNGKPWAAAPSTYRSIKIPDLASLLGTSDRIVDESTPQGLLDDLLSTPDGLEVGHRIQHLRERSGAYLNAALA